MYKDIRAYVTSWETYQVRSTRNDKVTLMDIEVPSYPFKKVSMDLSGTYSQMGRGKILIVSFMDWFINCLEGNAVKNKEGQTMAQLIIRYLQKWLP